MAATHAFKEDNGAATGGRGTTAGTTVTNVNWKNIDDTTTAYSSSPITAGNNSFTKYQYSDFSGTFNSVGTMKFSANTTSAGLAGSALATGLTLKGVVTSTYATPATAANGALTTDYTAGGPAVASGASVNVGTTGPNNAASSSITAAGQSQYYPTQLQTTTSAAAGDTATIYIAVQYNEN
jgi:hypothetical protein